MKNIITVICFVWTIFGCSASISAPTWLGRLPYKHDYHEAIGRSEDGGESAPASREAAYRNALAELSFGIRSEIAFSLSLLNKEIRTEGRHYLIQSADYYVEAVVKRALPALYREEYYDSQRKIWYVYLAVPKEVMERKLQEELSKAEKREKALSLALNNSVRQLFKGEEKKLKLSLGRINYQNTGRETPFSDFIKSYLKDFLVGQKEIILTPKGDEVIGGEYWLERKYLRLILVRKSSAEEIIKSHSFKIEKEAIPPNINFYTRDREESEKIARQTPKILRVKARLNREEGAVYQIGEELAIIINVTENCYLRVYHVNARGMINQLFPNNFSPSDFVQAGHYIIPDGEYKITVTGPQGTEVIWAVASNKPFSFFEASTEKPTNFENFSKRLRQQAQDKGVYLAEDMVSFIVVKSKKSLK